MSAAFDRIVIDGLMTGLLALAVFFDLRQRRIPNALTLPAASLALAVHLVWQGLEGLQVAALGWIVGVAVLAVPFALRGVGAGDVKLVAAIGALQGPLFVFLTCLYAALAGGLLAAVALGRAGKLALALQSLALWRHLPRQDGAVITAGRIPYAPAIAFGAFVALALRGLA